MSICRPWHPHLSLLSNLLVEKHLTEDRYSAYLYSSCEVLIEYNKARCCTVTAELLNVLLLGSVNNCHYGNEGLSEVVWGLLKGWSELVWSGPFVIGSEFVWSANLRQRLSSLIDFTSDRAEILWIILNWTLSHNSEVQSDLFQIRYVWSKLVTPQAISTGLSGKHHLMRHAS